MLHANYFISSFKKLQTHVHQVYQPIYLHLVWVFLSSRTSLRKLHSLVHCTFIHYIMLENAFSVQCNKKILKPITYLQQMNQNIKDLCKTL